MGVKQSGSLFQTEPRNSKAKLLSQVIIGTKHIHGNDFHSTSDRSIIFKKVISNDSSCFSFKKGDDIELVKVLSNKAHFSFCKNILVPRHNLSQSRKIILKTGVIEHANDS